MYIPGPAINITGTPRFQARKLFAETSRIKRKPPRITGEDEDKPGFLCWGEVGDLPSAEPVPEVSFEVVEETYTEVDRETTPVRIVNPDDPNQYVDALQTDKMKMKKETPEEKNNSATKDAELDEGGWEQREERTAFTAAGQPEVVYQRWIFVPPERAL